MTSEGIPPSWNRGRFREKVIPSQSWANGSTIELQIAYLKNLKKWMTPKFPILHVLYGSSPYVRALGLYCSKELNGLKCHQVEELFRLTKYFKGILRSFI